MDVAGRVEAVGRSVQGLEPGDAVFGRSSTGTLAEYTRAPADNFAPKAVNLSMEQAAAIPVSAFTALQALREIARVQPGQTVLITGASGGVGTFAVQIAKAFGAKVTGVCSTRNVDLVRSVGADHVIDYTRTDFTRTGTALRGHPRQRGGAVAVGCATRADPNGHPHPQQRQRRSLDRPPGTDCQGAPAVAVYPPGAAAVPVAREPRRPTGSEGAHRGGEGATGHRPHRPARPAAVALRYVGEGHTQGKVVVIV